MNFEVDGDELRKSETHLSNSSQIFKNYLSEWKKEIDNLKMIWSGDDANSFYIKMEDYLSKLDLVAETISTFSNTINNSYIIYEQNDNQFSKELDVENRQYEIIDSNNNFEEVI